jgi:hypothetical protein
MITVSANDVAFTDIAFDGNSLVTNACIRTTALRTNIVGGSFDHAPKAFALANGAGGGMKDIEIKSATMRPIDIEDCADTCIFDHVHNDALSNASLMVQGAGSATARKFITVTRCDWQTTGDAMILSAQQPTAIEYNAFDTDIQVNPTATWGVERIIANANSFTQSGAVGFYDSGTPGTLTTYAGLFESTEYKAP